MADEQLDAIAYSILRHASLRETIHRLLHGHAQASPPAAPSICFEPSLYPPPTSSGPVGLPEGQATAARGAAEETYRAVTARIAAYMARRHIAEPLGLRLGVKTSRKRSSVKLVFSPPHQPHSKDKTARGRRLQPRGSHPPRSSDDTWDGGRREARLC